MVRALLLLLIITLPLQVQATNSLWLLDIRGAIGPATADYVSRGIEQANQQQAPLIILRIDTPGGLDKSMRQMIKTILQSQIPVIGYVAPSGARAASAGTYLLYACHIAVMAPATNLGAATPVQIAAPSLPTAPKGKDDSQPPASSAMEKKIINDAVAYIEGLAELRGRNREWAVTAVRDGASLAAVDALKKNVIDLIADDLPQLLQQLDGMSIEVNHQTITLQTAKADIYVHQPDWRNEFLSVITDPNVAYILMLVGIYGLLFEFSNPGMGVPGIVGAICLLIALYAFQVLPVSYAGLGLILLGIALIVAEIFAPSFGALGLGGIVSFVMGSIILMDTELPAFQIALPVILAVATSSALLLFFVLGMIIKARQQRVITGLPHLVGALATVEAVNHGQALIRLEGELWQVDCDQPLQPNDQVRITAAEGVVLAAHKESGEQP